MLQKCYETLCSDCIDMQLSNLATKSAIVKSGTKSDIIESKEGETMTTTSTVSDAYTRVGELQAASCKQAASSIRGAVISETASYIYTREVVSYSVDRYFVDFKLEGGHMSWGCTVYNTRQEAERAIASEAIAFGYRKEQAKIRYQHLAGFKVVRHRYKKG